MRWRRFWFWGRLPREDSWWFCTWWRCRREYWGSCQGSWYIRNRPGSNILLAFGSKKASLRCWLGSSLHRRVILSTFPRADLWFLTQSNRSAIYFWRLRYRRCRWVRLVAQQTRIYLLCSRLRSFWFTRLIVAPSSYFSAPASSRLIICSSACHPLLKKNRAHVVSGGGY